MLQPGDLSREHKIILYELLPLLTINFKKIVVYKKILCITVCKPMFFSSRCEKIVKGIPNNVPIPKEIPRRNFVAPKSSKYQNKKVSRNPHMIPANRKTIKYDNTLILNITFRIFLKIFFAGGLKSKFNFKRHKDANRRNAKYKYIMGLYPLECPSEMALLSSAISFISVSCVSATSINKPAKGPNNIPPNVPKSF